MSTFLSLGPYPVLYPCITRSHTLQNPIFHRSHLAGFSSSNPHLRGTLTVAKFGFFNSGQFPVPEPESAERVIRELFGKAEGILFTLADAAVTNSEAVGSAKENNGDWLSGITNYMESVLKVLKGGLSTLHVPYAYGFAIILLTVLVKAVTFPLTKKQVESAMAMRSLQPQLKAIQKQYAGDQERIQLETARLYKLAGINPLAGCLPTLATIPVWIGLYRALSNVANEGLLTEGFFWIPSLAGPTTIAARQNGSGISWLFPFVDGHPPLGWSDTTAYLVLPVLLIASQYISIQIMQSSQTNDPNLKSSQILTKFLPLMIGYFSLSVPSGLSLYWFTNNILSTAQQVWLQKLGGAKNPLGQISDDTLKEGQQQSQITSFETKATGQQSQITSFETEAIQKEEKVTSTGLPPGERFRRLKEEEARRKRKRQEELMRKAEEAAATNAQQLKEEGHEKHPNQVDGTNGTMSELVDESVDKSHPVAAAQELSDNRVAVNGNTSNENHGASVSVQENDIPSSDTSGSRISHLDEDNSEKESVGIHGNSTFMDGQIQGEEQSGQK